MLPPSQDPRLKDSIDSWDQAKLEQVVGQKQQQKGALPATDIVCKYFLDAIEKNNYGWFWECPNGVKCHYRHALPLGYVFVAKKKMDDKTEEVDIGEQIEAKRKLLDISKCTPVTEESFRLWREKRDKEKAARIETERVEAAKSKDKLTRGQAAMSGRALFAHNPALFEDDDGAVGNDDIVNRRGGSGAGADGDDDDSDDDDDDDQQHGPLEEDADFDENAPVVFEGDAANSTSDDAGAASAAASAGATPVAGAGAGAAQEEEEEEEDGAAPKADKKDKKDKDDKKNKKEKKDKKDKSAAPEEGENGAVPE